MRILLLPMLCLPLVAQDRYEKMSIDQPLCPKIIDNSEGVRPGGTNRQRGTSGGVASALTSTTAGTDTPGKPVFHPAEGRKDISAFGVVDRSGKLLTVGDFRGKVVVVGFWTIGCDPSLKQLGELADLQGKGDKYGFKVFPTNVDPERWTIITPWLQQNADRLSGASIYTPGLGEHGPSVISESITGVPAVFITDRQGRVACTLYGFEHKNLVNALKKVLTEGSAAPAK